MEQLTAPVIFTNLLYLSGVALFARWLLCTSLGRKALVGAPPRRNRMDWYLPLALFFVWLLGVSLANEVVDWLVGPLEGWWEPFVENLVLCGGAVVTIVLILIAAQWTFARGLRGFGLRPRTIPRDLAYATGDLLAVWPLVLAMTILTVAIGKALSGPAFEMPRHIGLELVTHSPALPLRILVMFLAVVVAPLVEETLFRGMFQTTIRSYTGQPWLAIVVTSVLFASIHANATHWPALFVLAMGLGYAYEKSGSLWRAIFMHALFNGLTILAVLSE